MGKQSGRVRYAGERKWVQSSLAMDIYKKLVVVAAIEEKDIRDVVGDAITHYMKTQYHIEVKKPKA